MIDEQRSMLDELMAVRPRARTTDPDTSHHAAASIDTERGVGRQRQAVIDNLADAGPLTADEIDERIGWRATTAGRRMRELADLGLVRMLPGTALTRSGRHAHLWGLIR